MLRWKWSVAHSAHIVEYISPAETIRFCDNLKLSARASCRSGYLAVYLLVLWTVSNSRRYLPSPWVGGYIFNFYDFVLLLGEWLSEMICVRGQMSFGLFRMCIRGDCVIDITNRRLIRSFAAGGTTVTNSYQWSSYRHQFIMLYCLILFWWPTLLSVDLIVFTFLATWLYFSLLWIVTDWDELFLSQINILLFFCRPSLLLYVSCGYIYYLSYSLIQLQIFWACLAFNYAGFGLKPINLADNRKANINDEKMDRQEA